jgi:hypothetical protein
MRIKLIQHFVPEEQTGKTHDDTQKIFNEKNLLNRSYPNEEYCNVYHVCESGSDNIRQCPHQLYWDNDQQKCDWSNNVRCSGRTLVALSMEQNPFCNEKKDGYYMDQHCKYL